MTVLIFWIVVTILLSAYFSGMEIAFLASNRLQIEVEKKQGLKKSRLISVFIDNPKKFIATMLVGNNVSLVFYGILTSWLLEKPLSLLFHAEIAVIIFQTLISTLVILFVAEYVPKAIFRLNANPMLRFFAIPTFLFYLTFFPFSWFFIKISDLFISKKRHNKPDRTNSLVFGKIDLDHYIQERSNSKNGSEGDEYELKIFQNALDFSNVILRECIVPRTEMIAIEKDESIEVLKEKFIETGFSKILIYKNNIDNVIGYVHSSELLKKPEKISDLLHDVIIVPETMPANKLLSTFIRMRRSVAVIVDEFGGTAGMVTIEDIMEEIFGEIKDEHDTDDLEEKQLNENEFIFSGRLEVDYVCEKYGLDFSVKGDYETLAGFILHYHKSIPKANEIIAIENYQFKILKVTSTRIELVHIKLKS